MDSPQAILRLAVVVIASALVTGCGLTTTVETSRQIEAGDRVLSTSFGWPGYYLWLPRVELLGMYGLGDRGDVGPHVGLNRTSVNAGIGGRYYPTEDLIVGLRGDVERTGRGAEVRGVEVDAGTVTTIRPRVVTTADEHGRLYAGVQGSLINRWDRPEGAGRSDSSFARTVGLVGGFDHLFTRRGIQLEVVFSVVSFAESAPADGLVPSLQLNLGAYRFSRP